MCWVSGALRSPPAAGFAVCKERHVQTAMACPPHAQGKSFLEPARAEEASAEDRKDLANAAQDRAPVLETGDRTIGHPTDRKFS